MTVGQVKQITRFLIDAMENVAKCGVEKSGLSRESAQHIIVHGDLIRDVIEKAIPLLLRQLASEYTIFEETAIFRPTACMTIPASAESLDMAFFYEENSVYFSVTFEERFAHCNEHLFAVNHSGGEDRPYTALILKQHTDDASIIKALPKQYYSSLEDAARIINDQLDGKSGFLLVDNGANIFYVKDAQDNIFVLSAHFNRMHGQWVISDWNMNENGAWGWGTQIICPGHTLLTRT